MKNVKLLELSAFFLFIFFSTTHSCILWKNSKITTEFSNSTKVSFLGEALQRNHWFGFGIGKGESFTESTLYIFQLPDSIFKMNQTSREKISQNSQFLFDNSKFVTTDNIMKFRFEIDQKDLLNQTHVFFIQSTLDIPLNTLNFSIRISVESRKFSILSDGFSKIYSLFLSPKRLFWKNNR
jgi:hypothetical protein